MHTLPDKQFFTASLATWHSTENNRSLPWKSEKDPYRIWLSEVILQQTRAQQGLPYYLRFTEAYPTVTDMAAAADDDVFRLWQGLGYYNRCKNMLVTARIVAGEFGGVFPASHEGILQLKGIGPYTAAAIASFAFGLPHAVVDGNVYRVLARYFGIDIPFDTTEGKRHFAALAQELLDTSDSAAHNQAIMDLGATVCTPRNPLCDQCPLQKKCSAYHSNTVSLLPVRSKKLVVRTRYFHYLLLKWNDTIWLQKRTGSDIWENLHQPYLIESDEALDLNGLLSANGFKKNGFNYSSVKYEDNSKQRLTHQVIEARFYSLNLVEQPVLKDENGCWLHIDEWRKLAFPKTVLSFLENNFYF